MNIVTKKKITEGKGCILRDYAGVNSLSFLAKLPKGAVIDSIKADGVYLEDLRVPKIINTHREITEDEYRVIATVYFPAELPALYDRAANYQVTEFEVYYHDEAVVETE